MAGRRNYERSSDLILHVFEKTFSYQISMIIQNAKNENVFMTTWTNEDVLFVRSRS